MKIVRYASVLPVAILSFIVGAFLLSLFFKITALMGAPEIPPLNSIAVSILSGMLYMHFGILVAPGKKKIVAMLLFVFLIISTTFLSVYTYMMGMDKSSWLYEIFKDMFMVISSGFVLYKTFENEDYNVFEDVFGI